MSGTSAWFLLLLREFTVREFRSRYRQSLLDVLWSIITPLATMVVYGFVLSNAFGVTGDGIPYYVFAWSGMVLWSFFATSVGTATPSIINAGDLVAKVYFPRSVLPLAVVGASLVDLAIGLSTVVGVAVLRGIPVQATWLAAVIPVVVLVTWTCALSVLLGTVAVFVRDVNHAVQLVLRIGFFATPVMYPVTALPEHLRWTAAVNPVAVCIEGLRATLLRGEWPRWGLLGLQALAGAALWTLAQLHSQRVEARMADVV